MSGLGGILDSTLERNGICQIKAKEIAQEYSLVDKILLLIQVQMKNFAMYATAVYYLLYI